ncbi:hypothetical protein SSX86_006935 [Deinandra increscens subsp. villosa]|uniref:RRM domain-containing protein n=1 Tax=Deinandra increscens subsp. villosa TaxID=3103831 RepID=A0AAP0H7B0_9ASTR
MEAAAIMAIAMANGGGKPPYWQDFVGIVCLLVINSTISFIEENNAGNAAAALMAGLAPKSKVSIPFLIVHGHWSEQEASILVLGDIINIELGDIVPADARLLEGDPLKIDQSALTGESLPVNKNPYDEVFSGSTCKQGEIDAVVIATEVFAKGVDKEQVLLYAARASRMKNQDAIDVAIVGTLADPKEPFSQYGDILSVKIPIGKGCGFVQFANRNNAEEALQKLNGSTIGKQTVLLSWGRNPANKQVLGGIGAENTTKNQWMELLQLNVKLVDRAAATTHKIALEIN